MSAKGIVIGVVSGLAVGIVLGVLFAPDKGSETRKKLSRKGRELKNALDQHVDHLAKEANHKVEKINVS